jgi:hypothetical protein
MAGSAFNLGWQSERDDHALRRQRKQQLEDEQRQTKVADLHDQQVAIRANLAKLGVLNNPDDPLTQQGTKQIADIDQQLAQIYHPVNAPGVLQRDWGFLQGLITRRKQPPPGASVAPVMKAATPDVAISTPAQDVKQPGVPALAAAAPAPTDPAHPCGGTATPEECAKMRELAARGITATPASEDAGLPEQDIKFPAATLNVPGSTSRVTGPVSATMAVPPAKVQGLIAPGNLPIWSRPVVQNDDGSHSTEYSVSFKDENPNSPYYGKEVLVPTVVNGKFLTPDGKKPPEGSDAEKAMFNQAFDHYQKTGQQLGVFDTPQNADKYANKLHTRGERKEPGEAAYAPPQPTAYQRKLQAQQAQAQKDAQRFLAAGPLTPQQEAGADLAATMARINLLDKLPGLTDQERADAKQRALYAALGIPQNPKYFSQLQTTTDSAGAVHVYRVPMDPTMPPEEVKFGEGEKFTGRAGQTPKGMKFDQVTGQVQDLDTGKRYNRTDPNLPQDVKDMFAGFERMDTIKKAYNLQLASQRASTYNMTHPMDMLDRQKGNAPVKISFADVLQNPDRYIPASTGMKALSQQNLFEDIARVSRSTRDAINGLTEDFPEDMKAKIAVALTAEDHGSSLNALISSSALAHLTPDQFQFLVATRQLTENAMAMRSILGAGQSSDQVRAAIQATLPSLLSPNRQYALMQLDAFDKTLQQLYRGIPHVTLSNEQWTVQGGDQSGGAGAARGGRSISAVKQWMQGQPQWKGQTVTDDMASKYITSLGYTPTQ